MTAKDHGLISTSPASSPLRKTTPIIYEKEIMAEVHARQQPNKVIPYLASPARAAQANLLVDELVRRFLMDFQRQNHRRCLRRSLQTQNRRRPARRPHPHECHQHPRVYMRSLATRQSNLALSKYVQRCGDDILKARCRIRPDHPRNGGHRAKRHRDH
jgi:hypothetical protein